VSEKDFMSSERWWAALVCAGILLAVTGLARWWQQEHPRAAPAPLLVQLPRIVVSAAREHVDEQALYFSRLRSQVRWVPTRVGRATILAPDPESRMLLAKAAADYAHLSDVGLSFRDVYGIINAETSWVPRAGSSRDGTPNLGIAQFEPATAKALGLEDPDDVVESVHAAALFIKEAAIWSRDRLRGLKLGKAARAEKLREGISIYYSLSTRGRNQWKVFNTADLPLETQRHIANAKLGAEEATMLDAQLRSGDRT
jgi:hypothetical protein